MLLLIPSRHTTLSTLILCLIRSQKSNSHLFLSLTAKTKRVVLRYPDPRQFIYLIFVNVLHGSQDVWQSAWGMAHCVVNENLLAKRYTIDKKKLKLLSAMMSPHRPTRMICIRSRGILIILVDKGTFLTYVYKT